MLIKIPVSTGELIDKITILEIKKLKINDKLKLISINKEHKYLKDILTKKIKITKVIKNNFTLLKDINLILWDIEDKKRNAEKNKKFDKTFISLARKVYIYNDKRAEVKSIINKMTGSDIIEVKSYKKY
tara:strand:+ start:324 stop:710 length:387 start_codon:yes stop_codon:yes gene_type:complete